MMGCSPDDQTCDDDEKPAREVTLAKGFWIGQTLVTQAAFKRVMGESPSFFHGDDQLPVDKADFGDGYEYCATVGMRLPNEAESEYAARANNPAVRCGEPDAIAWYKDNSHEHSHEVAQTQPNAWQLYDMLGNLWEWTTDAYKPESDYRVLRRGSWRTSAAGMRVSFRGLDDPERHRNFTGFRCVGE